MAFPFEQAVKIDDMESTLNLPAPMLQVTTTEVDELAAHMASTISVTDFAVPPLDQFPRADSTPSITSRGRPTLQRNNSSFSAVSAISTISTFRTNLRGRSKSFLWSKDSSSKSSSTVHSPEIQAMIKREVLPDLDAVNKALETVNSSSDSSDEEKATCVIKLSALAAELEAARRDGKRLLNEAMQARSDGKYEICRANCLLIVHSRYAEIETRIYAYNILSTQASCVRQADRFLDNSAALVNGGNLCDVAKKERLLGVIALLRESAKKRAGKAPQTTAEEAATENQLSDTWYHRGSPKWQRSVVDEAVKNENGCTNLSLPDPATMDERSITPRAEKIFKWAGEGGKAKSNKIRTTEEILCSCGRQGRGQICLVHRL